MKLVRESKTDTFKVITKIPNYFDSKVESHMKYLYFCSNQRALKIYVKSYILNKYQNCPKLRLVHILCMFSCIRKSVQPLQPEGPINCCQLGKYLSFCCNYKVLIVTDCSALEENVPRL